MTDSATPSTSDSPPSTRLHLLPSTATTDAAVLIQARAVRAFGDGFVSVLLPVYLTALGYGALEVGAVVTATLVGSAAVTLAVGLLAHRYPRRALLLRASLLMTATGLGLALAPGFVPILIVALVGTFNPSSGDVSLFLPTEQALLPQTVSSKDRTALFARYSLTANLVGAVGALLAGLPDLLVDRTLVDRTDALRGMFVLYAALGLVALWRYRGLSPAIEPAEGAPSGPLRESRRVVLRLAALFSLDSLGGGFVVQTLLALWLFNRFDLSVATAGVIFFWSGLLSAFSQLAAPRLAARIGLLETAVYTHLAANALLIATPFMPTLPLAIATLLARSALSQMDVPVRTSYVMAVVPPAERAAAASVTNVPRSLASAATPLLGGYLLTLTTFGWPLVIGGTLKALYDVLLLRGFRALRPPEETEEEG